MVGRGAKSIDYDNMFDDEPMEEGSEVEEEGSEAEEEEVQKPKGRKPKATKAAPKKAKKAAAKQQQQQESEEESGEEEEGEDEKPAPKSKAKAAKTPRAPKAASKSTAAPKTPKTPAATKQPKANPDDGKTDEQLIAERGYPRPPVKPYSSDFDAFRKIHPQYAADFTLAKYLGKPPAKKSEEEEGMTLDLNETEKKKMEKIQKRMDTLQKEDPERIKALKAAYESDYKVYKDTTRDFVAAAREFYRTYPKAAEDKKKDNKNKRSFKAVQDRASFTGFKRALRINSLIESHIKHVEQLMDDHKGGVVESMEDLYTGFLEEYSELLETTGRPMKRTKVEQIANEPANPDN
jgi:hypothetical protein